MVACDSHPVPSFAENTCIWKNIEIFADLRKVEKLFHAEEVDVSRIVEGICLSLGRLLIEAYAEFAFTDSAVRIGASGKTTLLRVFLGIAFTAVGGMGLDPELEPRFSGTTVGVEWMQ